MEECYSWLQFSDLHIFDSTDWTIMQDAYERLAEELKPNFLVFTGDYRHIKNNPSYEDALVFIRKMVAAFHLKNEDVFFVPGNHDVNTFTHREEIVTTIKTKVERSPEIYGEYLKKDESDLRHGFREYSEFVTAFYGEEVTDDRIKKPSDVISVPWKNKLNVIILNTALVSNGEHDKKEIIDLKTFSKIKINKKLPSIILAHHDINCLVKSHKTRVMQIMETKNVRAYLCGDKHKLGKKGIDCYNIPNTSIPVIVCGKSAIEVEDTYSDLTVIEYKYHKDGNTYVQVYRYGERGFLQSNDFYHNIRQQYYFPMYNKPAIDNEPPDNNITEDLVLKKTDDKRLYSIWLPDAELAEGKQTRFNTCTVTPDIQKYFDVNSSILGIASVKGIGKTFLLQVKRVRSSRKYQCLPNCPRPSVNNNWATERVLFDSYSQLQTENTYDDLVLLWKNAIKCYVINNMIDATMASKIQEYVDSGKISAEIASLCRDGENKSLEAIVANILGNDAWNKDLRDTNLQLSNLCRFYLHQRKAANPTAKEIAVFIDKVDQSILQTNAEPPADCVVCQKRDNYAECKSKRKDSNYCSADTGCQSKNCCYGCELFASTRANAGLRIYENSNAARRIHVNIWQYLQLALMHAAVQLSDEFNGQINVFYTIRQEAFNCEDSRLGEQNQKIAGRTLMLKYSFEEQRQIFYGCIGDQDDDLLYDSSVKNREGMKEYAFVGVSKLCHPYCMTKDGRNQSESVFTSIYRHSFDRSRDIQRYGEYLTKKIEYIRACKTEHEREEYVKQAIEELAATLAYCEKQSESTVNPSYFTEKMRYLPNYWADNTNFENLLSLIDRNLLFEEDIKCICRTINGLEVCPREGCRSGECKRHPFTMLYKMGYLGYIVQNANNGNSERQHFLDACDISYFAEADDLMTAERVAYIIHPALSKTIEKKYNKLFMHFSGFILGKGLPVEGNVLVQMLEDRRTLDKTSFISKYYYSP